MRKEEHPNRNDVEPLKTIDITQLTLEQLLQINRADLQQAWWEKMAERAQEELRKLEEKK